MEPWELEISEHKQPPTFALNDEQRRRFHPAEDAVNDKLAKPPEATHLHREPEIARPASTTRHRVEVTTNSAIEQSLN